MRLACLLLFVAACTADDIWPDTRTPGSNGVLQFSYSAPSALGCGLSACPIDRPIATHGDARVVIDEVDPATPVVVATSSRDVTVRRVSQAFTCWTHDDYRVVEADEPCAKGEDRIVT